MRANQILDSEELGEYSSDTGLKVLSFGERIDLSSNEEDCSESYPSGWSEDLTDHTNPSAISSDENSDAVSPYLEYDTSFDQGSENLFTYTRKESRPISPKEDGGESGGQCSISMQGIAGAMYETIGLGRRSFDTSLSEEESTNQESDIRLINETRGTLETDFGMRGSTFQDIEGWDSARENTVEEGESNTTYPIRMMGRRRWRGGISVEEGHVEEHFNIPQYATEDIRVIGARRMIDYYRESDSLLYFEQERPRVTQRGLSHAQISLIPTVTYARLICKSRDEADACNICFGPYNGRQKCITLQCLHYFHFKCLVPWLKTQNSCPVCRITVGTK
jgi:hypothetical protein